MIVRALSRVFVLFLVVFGALCVLRFDGIEQRRRLSEGATVSTAEHRAETTTKSSSLVPAPKPVVAIQASNDLKGTAVDLVPGEVPLSSFGGQPTNEREDANVKLEKNMHERHQADLRCVGQGLEVLARS